MGDISYYPEVEYQEYYITLHYTTLHYISYYPEVEQQEYYSTLLTLLAPIETDIIETTDTV